MDNRSIYGNITSKGLVKLQKFFDKGETSDFCIIEFGSNDCDYDWGTLVQKVPLEEYLENLSQMISLCRANKVTPLMMGLIPYVCNDWFKTIIKGHDEAAILKFLGGTAETLGKNQLIYKNAQADFVKKNNVQFLDPWDIFQGHKELMCYDGIHPNEAGYEKLSQAWIKFLTDIKKEF